MINATAQHVLKTYSYKAYGLNIHSAMEIPELTAGNGAAPDLKIHFGNVPVTLPNKTSEGVLYEAMLEELVFFIQNVARYHIRNGNEIIIDTAPGADMNEVKLYLLGTPFGVLLHQRDNLVLHGSTIVNGEHCIAFIGPSGIGKSTLVAALEKRGYPVMTDDICTISFTGDNSCPVVQPESHSIRLWEDALVKLGRNTDELSPIKNGLKKYHFSMKNFHPHPAKLQKIYVLTKIDAPQIKLEDLRSVLKIKYLSQNTYRSRFVAGLGKSMNHFKLCTQVASAIPIIKITRPRQGFLLDELVEILEEDLKT